MHCFISKLHGDGKYGGEAFLGVAASGVTDGQEAFGDILLSQLRVSTVGTLASTVTSCFPRTFQPAQLDNRRAFRRRDVPLQHYCAVYYWQAWHFCGRTKEKRVSGRQTARCVGCGWRGLRDDTGQVAERDDEQTRYDDLSTNIKPSYPHLTRVPTDVEASSGPATQRALMWPS